MQGSVAGKKQGNKRKYSLYLTKPEKILIKMTRKCLVFYRDRSPEWPDPEAKRKLTKESRDSKPEFLFAVGACPKKIIIRGGNDINKIYFILN